jgi:hypothetical protein
VICKMINERIAKKPLRGAGENMKMEIRNSVAQGFQNSTSTGSMTKTMGGNEGSNIWHGLYKKPGAD